MTLLHRLIILFVLLSPTASAKTFWLTEQQLEFDMYDLTVSDKLQLYESADIYFYQDTTLLPFNVVTAMLEVNLIYDSNNQSISGKLENRPVEFMLENNDDLDWPVLLSRIEDELYIDINTLQYLLQSNISQKISDLTLNFSAKGEPYPIEKRLARANNKKVKLPDRRQDNYDFIVEDQYRLYTPPKGRFYLTGKADQNSESFGVNVQTYSDLLYHSAHLSMADNSENDITARLSMNRYQTRPDKKIFGLFNNYSFGDVSTSNTRLESGYQGLGLTFSSYENKYTSYYGKTNIEEDAPAGWQAELYKNGFLVSSSLVAEDGRLVFEQIDTSYGINRFEIKLYGPYGEEQTIEREIIVGQNMLKPGEFAFNGGLIDTNRSLFHGEDDQGSSPAAFIQTEYGINDKTSIGLSYFVQDRPSGDTLHEGIVNLSRQLPNALLDVTLFAQDDDKFKFDTNILGSVGKHIRYSGGWFQNENYLNRETDETFSSQQGFRGGISARYGGFGASLSGSSQVDTFVQGAQEIEGQRDNFTLTLNSRIKRFNITNNLKYSYNQQLADSVTLTDQLAISTSLTSRLYLRTAANFILATDGDSSSEFDSIEANLNWRLPSRVYSTFGIKYDKDDNYQANANFSLNRRKYNFVFGASYDNNDEWQLNAGVSFNIDYNYRTGQFNMQSEYSASSSTLDLLTYIDNNKNAQFDEYDEALSEVRFGIKPYWHDIRSSRNGLTYLPGSGHNAPVRVYFDTAQTKSPSLRPVSDNFRFYSHAGGVNSFDIPFNYNVMLDGLVEDQTSNQKANFVPIQVLNQKGQVLLEQLTDIENYYFFEQIWPGKYQLRVAPEYLQQKQLESEPKQIEFNVNGNEPILSLEPMVLSPKRDAAAIPLDTRKQLRKGEFYSVQFGVYNDRDYCIMRVAELKSIGIEDAYYSLATKYCKVLAGEFDNRQNAIDYRAQIPRDVLTDGFVTVYSEIAPLFTILIDSYISSEQCESFVSNTHLLANYVEKQRGRCRVYIGDFLTQKLAEEALRELPETIKRGANIVEY